jgi:uncharacterized membrane protein YbhN (UPF0104 family)
MKLFAVPSEDQNVPTQPLRRHPVLLTALAVALAVAGVAGSLALGIHLRPMGLAEAVLGSLLLVSCSALALNGSRPTPLPKRRAVKAVLATTAANAVTPAGLGGAALMMRLHKRSGLSNEQATAATALRTAFAALASLATACVAAGTVGSRHLPTRAAGIAGIVVITGALVVASVPSLRARVLTAVRRLAAAFLDVLRRPRCLASLVVGCTGVVIAQVLTLQGAVAAVGGHVAWPELLAALVGSAAARSAVPSPGGVGPIEAALVGGLTTMGMGLGAASIAVMIYRTAGHWLPVGGGVLSARALRARALL